MAIPYTSADFTTPRANGDSYIEYPFITQGDNATKVYHLICEVNHDDYIPIALDTAMSNATAADVLVLPFTADATAYCVGDYNITKRDGNLMTFDRQFANIPADRNKILTGTTTYTFPGFSLGLANATEHTAGAFTSTSTTTTLNASTSAQVGDLVGYSLTTNDGAGTQIGTSGVTIALTGTSSGGVTIRKLGALANFVSGSIFTYPWQPRGTLNVATGSFVDFKYYLPGVTANISDNTDIPLSTIFAPTSIPLSQATSPTPSDYLTKVSNEDMLIVSSEITRYKGNIAQRADVKVKAQ